MSDTDNSAAAAIITLIGGIVWLAVMVPLVWAHVRIIQKAGYSGWNVLWGIVPVANIIMLLVFAFSRWPIEDKIAKLEAKVF